MYAYELIPFDFNNAAMLKLTYQTIIGIVEKSIYIQPITVSFLFYTVLRVPRISV